MKHNVEDCSFRTLTTEELININGGGSNVAYVAGAVAYVLLFPTSWLVTEYLL